MKFYIVFLGALPAIRCNLLTPEASGPAQKDFHCRRAKRTGEAIGAQDCWVHHCSLLQSKALVNLYTHKSIKKSANFEQLTPLGLVVSKIQTSSILENSRNCAKIFSVCLNNFNFYT